MKASLPVYLDFDGCGAKTKIGDLPLRMTATVATDGTVNVQVYSPSASDIAEMLELAAGRFRELDLEKEEEEYNTFGGYFD